MASCSVTAEYLRQILRYDQSTGEFFWLEKVSRKVIAGEQAGTTRPDGYRTLQLFGKRYLAHRLAWLYVYGTWPRELLDHRDRNPSNNAIGNLREATDGQNKQNAVVAKSHNASSGLLGVTFDTRKKTNPWRAAIRVDGTTRHLGVFPTKEDAHEAYLRAKEELHAFYTL